MRALRAAVLSARGELSSSGPGQAHVRLHIEVEEDREDGGFVARCIDLPGCVSEGETGREAIANLVEAISGALEVRMQRRLDEIAPAEFRLAATESLTLELPVT